MTSSGASIAPEAGDPHKGTLLHFAMAINKNSGPVRMLGGFLQGWGADLGVSPLDWLGESIAVYLDDDSFWEDLRQAKSAQVFVEEEYYRMPIALRVEVNGALRAAAFIASVRAFIEQSAPGMTLWENLEHNGEPYVRVGPSAEAKAEERDIKDLAVYYDS